MLCWSPVKSSGWADELNERPVNVVEHAVDGLVFVDEPIEPGHERWLETGATCSEVSADVEQSAHVLGPPTAGERRMVDERVSAGEVAWL